VRTTASDLRTAIDEYLKITGRSQTTLASEAGVDQSTVSRALHQDRVRRTAGYERLCSFMRQEGFLGTPSQAVGALVETWDGSEEHAQALRRLILASGDLWPKLGKAASDRE
jgi:hypothetical protein